MGDLVQHFRYQLAPCGLGRGRLAPVLSPGFAYVTLPAKGLAAVWVVGILPGVDVQRHDVIAFQSTGPVAQDTAPAVALEDGTADGVPATSVQVGVVAAQVLLLRIWFLSGRSAAWCRVLILAPPAGVQKGSFFDSRRAILPFRRKRPHHEARVASCYLCARGSTNLN